MNKAGKWEQWQIDIIVKKYPTGDLAELSEIIGRSKGAISHFASRNGIAKDAAYTAARQSERRKGAGTPNFKGYRRKTAKGYFARYVPWHPYASKDGLVMEHRLVMEGLIGRYLTPDEVVHHKDGNKANNSPDNLQLMTQKEHTIMHNKRRKHHE